VASQALVEILRRIKPGKPATSNDYSSRLHAITVNRNATRAIDILLMDAIIQSFLPSFSQAFQRLSFRNFWGFSRFSSCEELSGVRVNGDQ
jgi:hypothetical protein